LQGGRSRRELQLLPGNASTETQLQAQVMAMTMAEAQALVVPQANSKQTPVEEEPIVQCILVSTKEESLLKI